MGEIILGIDYGSKRSGFTAAAALLDNTIHIYQCAKGEDADQWLQDLLSENKPTIVGLDAPLSLPGVYRNLKGCENYHYRHCDMQASAMSPMFIGGLTARAIALSQWIRSNLSAEVIEVYPKLAAQSLELSAKYKKDNTYLDQAQEQLAKALGGAQFLEKLSNWHQFDAALALLATLRYSRGEAQKIGREVEGLIYF